MNQTHTPHPRGVTVANSVLFVDDMPDMGALIVDILQCEGFSVDWCGSGADAAARLAEGRYGALVTDLVLGGGTDGRALATLAGELSLPVLIVSGDAEAIEDLRADGFDAAIKPVEIELLAGWLRRHLPARRAAANG